MSPHGLRAHPDKQALLDEDNQIGKALAARRREFACKLDDNWQA